MVQPGERGLSYILAYRSRHRIGRTISFVLKSLI